jgi:hypothetical protein
MVTNSTPTTVTDAIWGFNQFPRFHFRVYLTRSSENHSVRVTNYDTPETRFIGQCNIASREDWRVSSEASRLANREAHVTPNIATSYQPGNIVRMKHSIICSPSSHTTDGLHDDRAPLLPQHINATLTHLGCQRRHPNVAAGVDGQRH